MINWIDIKEREPELNAWVLVTYKFKSRYTGEIIWCKRIHQWTRDTHLRRRVTYWSEMNDPELHNIFEVEDKQ